MNGVSERLSEEIDNLVSIYPELKVNRTETSDVKIELVMTRPFGYTCLSLDDADKLKCLLQLTMIIECSPRVNSEDTNKKSTNGQFRKLSTEVTVKLISFYADFSQYPLDAPRATIRNANAFSETDNQALEERLEEIMTQHNVIDGETLFALITAGREALDLLRAPSVTCAVCLDNFEEPNSSLAYSEDSILAGRNAVCTRECAHLFHDACLREYVKVQVATHRDEVAELRSKSQHLEVPKLEVRCPVCRTQLSHDDYL